MRALGHLQEAKNHQRGIEFVMDVEQACVPQHMSSTSSSC